jgi:hypothetical protein
MSLGLIIESIPARKAWEGYLINDPDCYVVHWFEENKKSLVYETEICDTDHARTYIQA